MGDDVQLAISQQADDVNELTEIRDIYDIPIVSCQWVIKSVKCNKLLPHNAFIPHQICQIFTGCVICAAGLSKDDADTIWALITYYGGVAQRDLTDKVTHIVCVNINHECKQAKLVTPDWVTECVKQNSLLKEDHYHPKLIGKPAHRSSAPKPQVLTAGPPAYSGVLTQTPAVSLSPSAVNQPSVHAYRDTNSQGHPARPTVPVPGAPHLQTSDHWQMMTRSPSQRPMMSHASSSMQHGMQPPSISRPQYMSAQQPVASQHQTPSHPGQHGQIGMRMHSSPPRRHLSPKRGFSPQLGAPPHMVSHGFKTFKTTSLPAISIILDRIRHRTYYCPPSFR